MLITKRRTGMSPSAVAVILICFLSSAGVADFATSKPALTRPSTTAATQPASTQPAALLRNITLNFKDAPLDAVLDYFSEVGGFIIVKEGAIDGRVTVLSTQPISSAEAVVILNAALRVNGFAAIQNGRELKVMSRDQAKHGSIPVHFGADPSDVVKSDELITQVIPVRNVDAGRLRQDLTPLIGQNADMTANEGANAIVVTDISSNIRRIVEIVAALDQQETTSSALKVIQLKFANATSTAKLIEAIFKDGAAARNVQPGQPVIGPQGPQQPNPQQQDAGSTGRAHGGIIAAADERTNTLVLVGTADMLKLAEGLLKQLDSNTTPASELRAFPLKYGDAEAASKLISSIFKSSDGPSPLQMMFRRMPEPEAEESKAKVNTAFDDRTNTVIVTAPASAMKGIEELIKTLDTNSESTSQIKVWTLKYADADAAAKLINSIFNPTTKDSRQLIPIFIFGGGPSEPARGSKVNASSDDRTNTLIVTAAPETMKVVDGLVKQLDDNPTSEQTFFTYTVKNGQSQEIAATLNSLFGVPGSGSTGGRNSSGTTNTFSGASAASNRNNASNNNNANGAGANANSAPPINRSNNNQPAAGANVPAGIATAASSLTGQVFVVADADTNSLLVATATKYQDRVKNIITELDRPVPQVLIKVLIAEVTHDNSTDLGTDFSVLNTRASGNGQTIVSNLGNSNSQTVNGGLAVGLLETNLTATLHLLAQQNKLDVLSRPYILASDNQIATITIGQEVPIIVGSQISDLGSINNQIQYRQVGITLNVTPHINPEGLVILDVSPEVSQLTTQTVPVSNGVNAPIFDNRSADTRVGIRDGSTIVIGGMMQDQKLLSVKKVPLLGDIPWLGLLFQRQQIAKTKTELLIFLTPHVAAAPARLRGMSEDEVKGLCLTPNAVEPGVFQEHIRGLQRGGATTEPLAVPEPTTRPRSLTEPPLPGVH